MSNYEYPGWFTERIVSLEEAMNTLVKSGSVVASGFATNEPHAFYEKLWDHIQANDIHDLNIRQALFMAPHKVLFGDTFSARGKLEGLAASSGPLKGLASKINAVTKKLDGLGRLIAHYKELQERRIVFTSPFIGAANNVIIPPNAITNALYPEFVGRNTTRMGITDMQSVHFPDGTFALGYDSDNNPKIHTWIQVMTPPNEDGELSLGPANGANSEIVDKILEKNDANILLFINPKYPFTRGHADAPNTLHIERLKGLAEKGRLFVVMDDSRIPFMPKGSFDNPKPEEVKIAENVVNHIEMNLRYTAGRAIQVGIGGTGVLAIKALKNASWSGRIYTEMLEPFTYELLESGKIAGSHFIRRDGTREQLDGKIVCTFSMAEEGSDFYSKLHNNPRVVLATASRVVISEGFYYGMGINNILSIDFNAQVNSGGRFKNHHSGIGGAAQIHRGLTKGGISYLLLKSTYRGLDGREVSAITPFLPEGTPVSINGPDMLGGRENSRVFLVTEYGLAQVNGLSQSQFVRTAIGLAHPKFREQLKRRAWEEFRIKV